MKYTKSALQHFINRLLIGGRQKNFNGTPSAQAKKLSKIKQCLISHLRSSTAKSQKYLSGFCREICYILSANFPGK